MNNNVHPLQRSSNLIGWIAVGISTVITCLWAFWGIVENFHEGWYFESWLANIGMMFVQYLSPMLLFMVITLISIYWPRFGGGLQITFALLGIWFFQSFSNAATFLIILPLIGLGVMYWFGRPYPRKIAVNLVVGLPTLTLILSGIIPALRVSQRFNDGNLQARSVAGNGVDLIWAPDGPGWPREGGDWYAARQACRYLSADGNTIIPEVQDIWQLPTVEEAVRSMAHHGLNSGGIWQADLARATYNTTPDKESPLWNIHSPVIYWWTDTEIDEQRAFMIAYDGNVWSRVKQTEMTSLGFRCVR